jgi:hypothetical protein
MVLVYTIVYGHTFVIRYDIKLELVEKCSKVGNGLIMERLLETFKVYPKAETIEDYLFFVKHEDSIFQDLEM